MIRCLLIKQKDLLLYKKGIGMKKLLMLTIFFMITIYANQDYQWVYQPFEESMSLTPYPKALALTQHILQYDGMQLWTLGKRLFDQFNPSAIKPEKSLKIPKKIHQIWIGSELPEVFKKYIDTWKRYHPDWEYVLWTDEKVAQEMYPLYNQKYYDETESMGVKSDLLKWEIIYRYGGVYVDVDFECLKSLDQLHYMYDFYTAYQPLDAFFVQLGAALFAGWPGHPILKHCIETIKDDWHHKGAPKKSGPVHFSKSFLVTAGKDNRKDIAFPSFYMYPLGSREHIVKRSEWVQNGAYAVHHWAMSWMPKDSRRSEFRTFDNKKSDAVWND